MLRTTHTFSYIGLSMSRFMMNWRNFLLLSLPMAYARRITISRLYTSMFQFGRYGNSRNEPCVSSSRAILLLYIERILRNTSADGTKSMSAISSTVIHTSLSGMVMMPPSVILMMPRSKTSFGIIEMFAVAIVVVILWFLFLQVLFLLFCAPSVCPSPVRYG